MSESYSRWADERAAAITDDADERRHSFQHAPMAGDSLDNILPGETIMFALRPSREEAEWLTLEAKKRKQSVLWLVMEMLHQEIAQRIEAERLSQAVESTLPF